MPADLFAVAVDWYGPSHSLSQAQRLGRENQVEECLYVAYEPSGKERSYVGISKNISGRITPRHDILGGWPDGSFELWIGIVVSQSEPGRKPSNSPKIHSEALNFAEHATAFFVETSENRRKVQSPPKRSGILFNRWFKLEPDWPRHKERPHRNWPDFIEYDENENAGRTVYFGGHIESFNDL